MKRYTYDKVRLIRDPPYVRRNLAHSALDKSLLAPRVGLLSAQNDRYGITRTLVSFHDDVSQIEIDGRGILVAVLDLTIFHTHDLAEILLLLRNAIVEAVDVAQDSSRLSGPLGLFDSCWELYKRANAGHGMHLIKPKRTSRCRALLRALTLAEIGAIALVPHKVGVLAESFGLTPGEALAAVVGVHLATSPAERLLEHLVSYYHSVILPRLSRRLRYVVDLKNPGVRDLEIIMASLLIDVVAAAIKPGSRNRLLISIDAIDTLAGDDTEETFRRNRIASIASAADAHGFNVILAGRQPGQASWSQELGLAATSEIDLDLIKRFEVEDSWSRSASAVMNAVCNIAFADAGEVPAGRLESAWNKVHAKSGP